MERADAKHPGKVVSTGACSAGVLVDGGLYMSGQGPLDLKTGEVLRGTIEEETRVTMRKVQPAPGDGIKVRSTRLRG